MRNVIVLIAFVAVSLAAGAIGGWLTAGAVRDWYPAIAKPDWNPPGWIFGPVWMTLYVLMGMSAFLVWRRRSPYRNSALTLFASQLILNAAWSGIFFGLQQIGWAAVEIVVLWLAIVVTTVYFWRVSRIAGALLLPYIGWVGFATALNLTIWQLNRE